MSRKQAFNSKATFVSCQVFRERSCTAGITERITEKMVAMVAYADKMGFCCWTTYCKETTSYSQSHQASHSDLNIVSLHYLPLYPHLYLYDCVANASLTFPSMQSTAES